MLQRLHAKDSIEEGIGKGKSLWDVCLQEGDLGAGSISSGVQPARGEIHTVEVTGGVSRGDLSQKLPFPTSGIKNLQTRQVAGQDQHPP
jgi:hypothetical protein